MKAYEIIEKLFTYGKDFNYTQTCDTLKCGDPDAEVTKVVVAMFPTVELIKNARDWGAQLLIVHEPIYYNHMDEHSDERIECEKRALLEDSGMTVYRFHDHPHRNARDLISEGEYKFLGLDAEYDYTKTFDLVRLRLNTPLTPVELAEIIEEKLGIAYVRICGTRDEKCTNVSSCFGAPGDVMHELVRPETEILLMGETCEWRMGEYARDASQLGYKKALLILGHVGSESAGMIHTADLLKEMLPELDVRFFDCGEVYTYTR